MVTKRKKGASTTATRGALNAKASLKLFRFQLNRSITQRYLGRSRRSSRAFSAYTARASGNTTRSTMGVTRAYSDATPSPASDAPGMLPFWPAGSALTGSGTPISRELRDLTPASPQAENPRLCELLLPHPDEELVEGFRVRRFGGK